MIEAVNLRVAYGAVEALKGVSFLVPPGEICGYLGPNGAGKSSTVRCLTGLLRPGSGSARICGHDLAESPVEAKRRFGYVPETAATYTMLTIREYLSLVGELHELPVETIAERSARLVESFDLAASADRPIETLSKGQRQRVALSAALLHDPEALILDEPLTGLDAVAARTVKDVLAGLAARGRAILFCSHVLEVVERLCGRVIVLHQGVVVADGPTAEILGRTREGTLEAVFRSLTVGADAPDAVKSVLDALGGG